MKYIDLPDGTLLKALSPMDGVPFYSDWLEALLQRRAAFVAPGRKGDIDPETGLPRQAIVPYDRNQEQAAVVHSDGTVEIICIGCAQPTTYMDIVNTARFGKRGGSKRVSVGKIMVGGIVQFGVEEPIDERFSGRTVSLVRRWRMRSVSKAGYGCPSCVEMFMEEDARVAAENANKQAVYDAIAEAYLMTKQLDKLRKLAPPKLFTAWLDILGGEIKAGQFTAAQQGML